MGILKSYLITCLVEQCSETTVLMLQNLDSDFQVVLRLGMMLLLDQLMRILAIKTGMHLPHGILSFRNCLCEVPGSEKAAKAD